MGWREVAERLELPPRFGVTDQVLFSRFGVIDYWS